MPNNFLGALRRSPMTKPKDTHGPHDNQWPIEGSEEDPDE